MKYNKIPLKLSIYLRCLYQDGKISAKDLVKRFPQYSRRSIYRHASFSLSLDKADKRKLSKGRPHALNDREVRHLLSSLKQLRRKEQGVFTSTHLQEAAGLKNVSNRTIRLVLNRNGYGFHQYRKKGQLTAEDYKVRLRFAKTIKRKKLPDSFWKEDIAFYIDGVSFVHKSNPCAQAKSPRTHTWRKKKEGLSIYCTAKAKKEGTGGSVAKFTVLIAYGKGVIGVHQYRGNINGGKYAQIVRDKFPDFF